VIAALALPGAGPIADRSLELLVLLALLAVLPAALVTLTSFLKISVVLSIARSALGAPQVPPATSVTGLALLLSATVMAPVARDALAAARAGPPGEGIAAAAGAAERAAEPLRAFLDRHARPDDREAFLDVARRLRPPSAPPPGPADLSVLAPAFVISELRRAFTIGFVVFVPFLAVDLVVANVLLALGLTQLSPTSVSLPFKLLLFVAVDGWRLLARGLALSYLG
jgi:type III secretion protein R